MRRPLSRAGWAPDNEAKRSSNEGALAGGSAAETSGVESFMSASQAAAPSDSAIAARDSKIVSARPTRRRDNSLSAPAVSETIRSPKSTPEGAHPHPETLYQLPHWEPKVRHNRGGRDTPKVANDRSFRPKSVCPGPKSGLSRRSGLAV